MLNSKFNVNRIEWLDLVFENRNQSYGAYVLRRDSGNYLKRALLIAISIFAGSILLSAFTNRNFNKDPKVKITTVIDTTAVDLTAILEPEKPKKEEPKVEQSLPKQQVEDLRQVKLIANIKPVNDVLATAEIPTIEDVNKSLIGMNTNEGKDASEGINSPSENKLGTGGNGIKEEGSNEPVNVNLLEVYPEFPGGMEAWAKFLNKNLRYPYTAQENNIQGRVTVSFVVERDGEITNLKVIRGIGAGCDEEAMRVIKKSPLWKSGVQNGRKVRVSYVMPIVFKMNN
ncbi:MAG: energy transducer TonB [Pelobium sp.]